MPLTEEERAERQAAPRPSPPGSWAAAGSWPSACFPEFDGRIVGPPFCFEEEVEGAVRYVADPGRCDALARLAVAHARLRSTPNARKRRSRPSAEAGVSSPTALRSSPAWWRSDVGVALLRLGGRAGSARAPFGQRALGILTGVASIGVGCAFIAERSAALPALFGG